ncbi:MAG: peptidoglycan-associated lipoprotein Pal [Pseudomonadota bacterium]
MKAIIKLIAGSICIVALAACSSTEEQPVETVPEPVEETQNQASDSSSQADDTQADTSASQSLTTFARNAINDPSSPLNQKIIYFDFDQSSILPEYMEVIANHAQYLSDFADAKVRLEGHADERGTREYNVALGERRAEAVRRLLLLQGASVNQVSIISYGEELPAALAHDEEAWSLNRRVELVYEAQ